MKKAIRSAVAAVSILVVVTAMFTVNASAKSENAAEIASDFRCTVFNADGTGSVSDYAKNHSVITNSARNITVMKCKIDGVENYTGKAAHFHNFLCYTFKGPTRNSQLTISASGVATLSCMVRGDEG